VGDGGERGTEMGDIPDASLQSQMPVENISGIGVAGPSAEPAEDVALDETTAVQRENAEYSEEYVGRNVDVEA